ncbi:MAG: GntR family transcriptional regulator [Bacteroidota bacterium]
MSEHITTVFGKIQELEGVTQYSKHEQLVQGVINAISDKILVQGDMLPSVNKMVKELGFASKTIVKAYRELIERGLVESKNRLGYFIVNEATEQTVRVALLLYAFHPIQEAFYNSFRSALGDNVQLDVFFHHSNIEIFETILRKIKGQYGMYVVAPIPHPKTQELLKVVAKDKLLMVDRYEPLENKFSHVTQEFEISTYMALKELLVAIRKFDEIILFLRPDADHPVEIGRAFEKFLADFHVEGRILRNYTPGSIKKGTVYFTIGDGDLWSILKDSKEKNLEVGKDIGVLSNSNDPVKEIICGGITTNSIDFSLMGHRAAEYVLNREPIQETIPTILTRRNSL